MNELKVGDYVHFINGDFLVGVVTKIAENGYVTVIHKDGGMEIYRKEVLSRYDKGYSIEPLLNSFLSNIILMEVLFDKFEEV